MMALWPQRLWMILQKGTQYSVCVLCVVCGMWCGMVYVVCGMWYGVLCVVCCVWYGVWGSMGCVYGVWYVCVYTLARSSMCGTRIVLPKLGALCKVMSRITLVPKQDHINRNCWATFFRDPCLLAATYEQVDGFSTSVLCSLLALKNEGRPGHLQSL